MAYSQVGIVNLALGRIGVESIAAMTDDSTQAIRANAVWEYILYEVLEAKDWRFAKTRAKLSQSATTPTSGWDYAYPLPSDFLRLARGSDDDPRVEPEDVAPYAIEAEADGTLSLFTDKNNDEEDIYVNYIRKVTDATKFTAHFIGALANRLGAELAITLTEGGAKFDFMMKLYDLALTRAEELNQSLDYVEDEDGSDDWADAGRT